MNKLGDIVIYEDPRFFCAFPSLVRQPDGRLLVAFRRAPERRPYGGRCTHADPNAHLVSVESADGGQTWSRHPELIHAHALGGAQDPCLALLPDGTLLGASYLWVLQQPACPAGGEYDGTGWKHTFAGGFLVRRRPDAPRWEGPILPPPVPGCLARDAFGQPLPAYNRGNILAARDGRLYWAVVRTDAVADLGTAGSRTSVHLLVSDDGGEAWSYLSPIAADDRVGFNETWLHETDAGDLVAFLRTDDPTGAVPAATARSHDRGRSFEPWQNLGFAGHPHAAARLPDGRILLVYGYRLPPRGIRARVLDPDCRKPAAATELVLRDDGGSSDLGYPWPLVFPDGRVLVAYYFNRAGDTHPAPATPAGGTGTTAGGGIRHIAATWLQT